jgi:D-glycero-D-manno-heptose 1,7-bisphosphate phosphatase
MSIDLILFDRDGTLNKRVIDGYVLNHSQLAFPPDISSLSQIKCKNVALVTNQSCIGRGFATSEDIATLNQSFQVFFSPSTNFQVFVCPHLPSDRCSCRKPNTGLLVEALHHFDVEAKNTIFVGDSKSDFQAAYTLDVGFIGVCWDASCWSLNCLHTIENVVSFVNESYRQP